MATAEAVAHGLPIVAYATGAIGDWIEDGVNGRLIALGQPEQFFQALRQLLTEGHNIQPVTAQCLGSHRKLSLSLLG